MMWIIVGMLVSGIPTDAPSSKRDPDGIPCTWDVDCGKGECWVGECVERMCIGWHTCV